MRYVIGITGGIASGKSTVCKYLQEQGYVIIAADDISRRISQIGGSLYIAIKTTFGEDYFLSNGELDRKKLGKYIYENSVAREKLNMISHPLIVEEMKILLKNTTEKYIFLDIPLLFEAKLSYLCDTIVCVYTDHSTQLKRLMDRDHISKEYAEKKISSQMSLEKKKSLADYVIESVEDFNETKKNINLVLEKLKENKYGTNR